MKSKNENPSITDEMIMAYVDGELAPAQEKEVALAIAADENLQQREILFRQTASVLGEAFEGPLHEKIPDRLLAVLRVKEKNSLADRFNNFLSHFGIGFIPLPATAMAMVAVMVIAVVLTGNRQESSSDNNLPHILTSSRFSHFLDTYVSGSTGTIFVNDTEAEVVPLLTFQDKKGRYCRYFEMSIHGYSIVGQGISCRRQRGDWETVAFADDTPKQEKSGSGSGQNYELASGENRMEKMVESMRSGLPLRLEEEHLCIDKAWISCK